MKKMLTHIKFIGDLQIFVDPFLSLYFDYKKGLYALFVNLSDAAKNNQYLFFYANKEQILDYMHETIGLKDISADKPLYITEKRQNGTFKEINEIPETPQIFEFNRNIKFDPDYCLDYYEIIWSINN